MLRPTLRLMKLVLVLGCRDEPPPPLVPLHLEPAPAPAWFIVTWDAARHSHVGTSENSKNHTPFFDTLASQGVRFMEARSVAPMRLPALASLHTGRSPQSHGLRINQSSNTLSEMPTTAMLLQEEGFRSAAFISAPGSWNGTGIMSGFDTINIPPIGTHRPDSVTVEQAIQWIDGLPPQDSLFAWIHLSSPLRPWENDLDSDLIQHLGSYRASIAEVDHQTSQLFSALETNGRATSTRMFIAGTHGHSLGEHGEESHGWNAFDATLRVPMVLWWGIESSVELNRDTKVFGPVSLLDILPTMGAIDGFEVPNQEGISLVAHVPTGTVPKRELAFESLYPAIGWGTLPIFGVLDESGQTWFDGSPPTVYDLQQDPEQLHNRYDEVMADEARELFHRFPRDWTPPRPIRTTNGIDVTATYTADEWIEDRYWNRLSPNEMYPWISDLLNDHPHLNPHQMADQCMELLEKLGPQPELIRLTLKFLDRSGQRNKANQLLEGILSEFPEWDALLSERKRQERNQRALASRIRNTLASNPQHETAPVDLAITLSWLEEWSEAEAQLIAITQREPTDIRAHIQLARLYLKQKNPGRALQILEKVQTGEIDPRIECERARIMYRYMNRVDEAVSQLLSCQSNGGTLQRADHQVIMHQSPI